MKRAECFTFHARIFVYICKRHYTVLNTTNIQNFRLPILEHNSWNTDLACLSAHSTGKGLLIQHTPKVYCALQRKTSVVHVKASYRRYYQSQAHGIQIAALCNTFLCWVRTTMHNTETHTSPIYYINTHTVCVCVPQDLGNRTLYYCATFTSTKSFCQERSTWIKSGKARSRWSCVNWVWQVLIS